MIHAEAEHNLKSQDIQIIKKMFVKHTEKC